MNEKWTRMSTAFIIGTVIRESSRMKRENHHCFQFGKCKQLTRFESLTFEDLKVRIVAVMKI